MRELSSSSTGFVMATGGGTPCFHKGLEVIKKNGVSVYLNVPLPELVKRNSKSSTRPLLQDGDIENKLAALLAVRATIYSSATFTIHGDQISIKALIALLRK